MPIQITVFLINLFFIYSLQSLSYTLSIYAMIGQKIEKRRYIVGTLIVLVSGILIRLLPIQRGVHTLLLLAIITLTTSFYLKFPIYTAVKATLASMILLLITEMLNLFIYKLALSDELYLEITTGDGVVTAVSGIPANIFFLIIVFIVYNYTTRHGKSLVGDDSEKSGDNENTNEPSGK